MSITLMSNMSPITPEAKWALVFDGVTPMMITNSSKKLHSFGWTNNKDTFTELVYCPAEGRYAGKLIATPEYEAQSTRMSIEALHPGVLFQSDLGGNIHVGGIVQSPKVNQKHPMTRPNAPWRIEK